MASTPGTLTWPIKLRSGRKSRPWPAKSMVVLGRSPSGLVSLKPKWSSFTAAFETMLVHLVDTTCLTLRAPVAPAKSTRRPVGITSPLSKL